MIKRLRTYLSGGMEYATNEGEDWRSATEQWIHKELGHSVFNPNTESEKFLSKHLPGVNFRKLKSSDIELFQRVVRKIVRLDSHEIAHRTDYVICYWDRSALQGAGTKGELTLARFFHKPVFMVTRMRRENIPGWILGCTTEIFGSFDQLKAHLKKTYVSSRH